jgi:hypothetical protein
MLPSRHLILTLSLAACALLQAQAALAAFGISSVSGDVIHISPSQVPVLPGNPNGSSEDPDAIIFREVQGGLVGAGGLNVDHDGSNVVAAPIISVNTIHPNLIPTTLVAATLFDSYMFHFDPIGIPTGSNPFYVATVNFDNPIIGVQLFSNSYPLLDGVNPYVGTLEDGDAAVVANGGPPAAFYPSGNISRGVEEDFFQIAISGSQLLLAGKAFGTEIDQVRILTVGTIPQGFVPEPIAALTWGILSFIAYAGAFLRHRS